MTIIICNQILLKISVIDENEIDDTAYCYTWAASGLIGTCIGYACCGDKNPYRHDGRADKNSYRNDRRADKNPYRHDSRADSQCRKYWLNPGSRERTTDLDLLWRGWRLCCA